MARSAPTAIAARRVSWQAATPIETATTSLTVPASLSLTASSMAISSKGLIDIFRPAMSTAVPSDLMRTLTLGSTTRLTATRAFFINSISGLKIDHDIGEFFSERDLLAVGVVQRPGVAHDGVTLSHDFHAVVGVLCVLDRQVSTQDVLADRVAVTRTLCG